MTIPLHRIWDELHVDKETALNFIVVFARFEYALKRCGFLQGGYAAQPDWNCFSRAVTRECGRDALSPVFGCAEYLMSKPTRRQIVRGDTLGWEDPEKPHADPSLSWLLNIVKTTRNNLFHGGKFVDGPEAEPLRDVKLICESTDVLLECLELDCDSARRVRDVFCRFDGTG